MSGQAKAAFFTTGAGSGGKRGENCSRPYRTQRDCRGGFHGRTYMTMALTGKVAPYKIGFGPFPGSVYHMPYPSDLHSISTQDSLDAIERLFKSDIEAKQVAAIIFEPVQGEAVSTLRQKSWLPLFAALLRRARYCDDWC